LWHKRPHENSEHICVRGIYQGCENPVRCDKIYANKEGTFCIGDGQSAKGSCIIKPKHLKLVFEEAFGAFSFIKVAMDSVQIRKLLGN